jgi:hypothetical protein
MDCYDVQWFGEHITQLLPIILGCQMAASIVLNARGVQGKKKQEYNVKEFMAGSFYNITPFSLSLAILSQS